MSSPVSCAPPVWLLPSPVLLPVFGVGPTLFTVITFGASALFATASGTGFGTIAAAMGVLYPAGIALGCHPALLAGIIISGAAFGDNLAPVSDTTICSATSQGVDVPGVVRSRLKYSAVAAARSAKASCAALMAPSLASLRNGSVWSGVEWLWVALMTMFS